MASAFLVDCFKGIFVAFAVVSCGLFASLLLSATLQGCRGDLDEHSHPLGHDAKFELRVAESYRLHGRQHNLTESRVRDDWSKVTILLSPDEAQAFGRHLDGLVLEEFEKWKKQAEK